MSKEEDKEEKKETMFDKFYKNRWYWIGLMLIVTVALELQFGSMNQLKLIKVNMNSLLYLIIQIINLFEFTLIIYILYTW